MPTANRGWISAQLTQRSFQSAARSVTETSASLPSESAEHWIAVQALTDESVSDEAPYFTGPTVTKDPALNERDSTDADYTTTTAVTMPTPCTPIALPETSSTLRLGRISHRRTKWGLPPQSESTQLHG